MKTTGKTWKELETTARIGSNGNLWSQPYMCHLGAKRITSFCICIEFHFPLILFSGGNTVCPLSMRAMLGLLNFSMT